MTTAVSLPIHPQSLIHSFDFSPLRASTWKTTMIARTIFYSYLIAYCGPISGIIHATVIIGIEQAIRAVVELVKKHFSSPVKEEKTCPAEAILMPSATSIDQLVEFFRQSPNFAENPEFEKFVREQVHIPNGTIRIQNNQMIISLNKKVTLHFDPEMPITKEEFLRMNRHTDTENLLKIEPNGKNPLPQKLPPLKLGSLTYLRSFGEIVTGLLQRYHKIPLGPEITLKMNGNQLEFVKGGLMNISSITFENGFQEERGLVSITTTTLFLKITLPYFLSDLSWLIQKLCRTDSKKSG